MLKTILFLSAILVSSQCFAAPFTTNKVLKAKSGNQAGDSLVTDTGTNVGISSSSPTAILDVGGKVAFHYNASTNERGMMVRVINRTGHTSVKGELVSASTATDREAILQANEYDMIGVVQEAGVAEGTEMWIWVTGSICQVLYKDTVAATRGNILLAADTDGRAIDVANPGGGLPGTDTHFKECGHVLETKSGGTNVLVLADIHFN